MIRSLTKLLILSAVLISYPAFATETYFGPQKIGGFENCEVQIRSLDPEKAEILVIFHSRNAGSSTEVISLNRSPWDEPGDYMREIVRSRHRDGSAAVTDIQFIRLSRESRVRARDGIDYYNRRFTTSYPGRLITISDLEACPNLKTRAEAPEPQAKPGVVEDAGGPTDIPAK